jgi:hypothetical protein
VIVAVAVVGEVKADSVGPALEVFWDEEPVVPAEAVAEVVAMERGCPPVVEDIPDEETDEDTGLRANPIARSVIRSP